MRHSVWVLRGVLAAAMATALAGCYKGNFGNCAVSCASSADCPGDLACSAQGLCSVGGASCEGMIPMPDADLTMPQTLTVTKTGMGSVASTPSGIDCGDTCTSTFPPLSSVMLTATPESGGVFDGWTGDCASSTGADCSLTMDGPKSAGAKFATHGALRWVKTVSYSGQDYFDGTIATDPDGNVIAAGTIDDNDTKSVYVVKYSKVDGAIIWEKKIDPMGLGTDIGGVATDSSGNIYLCSRLTAFGMSATIGGTVVTGDLYGNLLAMRLSGADGNIDWVKQWGGSAQEVCGGVVVSGTDVWFTGYTSSDPSTFDGVTLTGAGVNSGFIVKASTATGTVSLGKALVGNFSIYDIAENNGQIAIAGTIRSSYPNTSFPGCGMTISGSGDEGFFLVVNSNMSCAFARNYGSFTNGELTGTDSVIGVPGGGWIVTGAYQGSVTFGSSGIPNQGMRDAFIAKYNSAGTNQYAFGYGGPGNDGGRDVAVLPTGEVIFMGEFASTMTMGTTTLTGTNDIFITRLSAGNAPTHQWVTKVGGTAYENGQNVAVDSQGTVTVIANWTGMSDVGGNQLTAQMYDSWIASFVR